METERCWRGKRAALLLGAIRAFSAINNAECWASISQVGSVPARTLYTGREKERKSEELSSPRFSPPLSSTMAKGSCLGLSGFHSHALDGARERKGETEGVWENAYRCDCASLSRHGRLHNLLTPMENKRAPSSSGPTPAPQTFYLSRDHEKCKQVVDHLGMSLDRVPPIMWIILRGAWIYWIGKIFL